MLPYIFVVCTYFSADIFLRFHHNPEYTPHLARNIKSVVAIHHLSGPLKTCSGLEFLRDTNPIPISPLVGNLATATTKLVHLYASLDL